jgi:hypothetical protein
MAWSGSDILYIITQEMLSPEEKLGDSKSSGTHSWNMSGGSRFCGEDQAGLTLMEYVRATQRGSLKGTC